MKTAKLMLKGEDCCFLMADCSFFINQQIAVFSIKCLVSFFCHMVFASGFKAYDNLYVTSDVILWQRQSYMWLVECDMLYAVCDKCQ